ncbi:MAG TPA: type II toxin-antitoxin system HipA family toxin [Parvibaculum sp.]|jgi:serine/threonine-protein kinase HipA
MARHSIHAPLHVFLNGRLVGRLRRAASGAIDFQYDEAWLAWEHTIPASLSLPLRKDRYVGAPVVAVFDNLLPDNDDIRRRVAERAHAEGIDAYSLLAAIGHDCVGALQFLHSEENHDPVGARSGVPVSDEEIEHILLNLASTPLGVIAEDDFRISIAGAQEKTALSFWDGVWHKPTGTTATTHILKPQIGKLPNGIDLSRSVENEYLCLKLTEAFGLPSAKVEMMDFGSKRTLLVERFDRLWAKDGRLLRRPQEDFCQALSVSPTQKYEDKGGPGLQRLLELLKASDDPQTDQRMLLKAAIAFWLLGATDGHAKNFSLFLLPSGRFQMTPLYDVLSAQPHVDRHEVKKNQMRMAMSAGNTRHYRVHDIAPRHFIETAAKASIPAAFVTGILVELFEVARAASDRVLRSLPDDFPMDLAHSIVRGMEQRLSVLEQHLRVAT